MKRNLLILSFALTALTIQGCSSIQPVSPEVNSKIIVSDNPAPKTCHYLGQALGSQGNFITGKWTSNANLEQGAMTDLKNKAYAMGGNYVQIITNRAGVTGNGYMSGGFSGFMGSSSSEQTNVTSTGNVYKCDSKAIGLN